MRRALALALELLEALRKEDVKTACTVVDKLKSLMDTFKRSC